MREVKLISELAMLKEHNFLETREFVSSNDKFPVSMLPPEIISLIISYSDSRVLLDINAVSLFPAKLVLPYIFRSVDVTPCDRHNRVVYVFHNHKSKVSFHFFVHQFEDFTIYLKDLYKLGPPVWAELCPYVSSLSCKFATGFISTNIEGSLRELKERDLKLVSAEDNLSSIFNSLRRSRLRVLELHGGGQDFEFEGFHNIHTLVLNNVYLKSVEPVGCLRELHLSNIKNYGMISRFRTKSLCLAFEPNDLPEEDLTMVLHEMNDVTKLITSHCNFTSLELFPNVTEFSFSGDPSKIPTNFGLPLLNQLEINCSKSYPGLQNDYALQEIYGSSNLKSIYMSLYNISNLNSLTSRLTNLESLTFFYCELGCDNDLNAPCLKEISIYGSGNLHFPKYLNCPALKILNIEWQDKDIKIVTDSPSNIPDLEELTCNVKISLLYFKQCPSLTNISLKEVPDFNYLNSSLDSLMISDQSDWSNVDLTRFYRLKSLKLKASKPLSWSISQLSQLTNLTLVDIAGINIQALDGDIFRVMPYLKILFVDNCGTIAVTNFHDMPITVLCIQNCHITSFDVYNMPFLSYLTVRGGLSTINSGFTGMPNLECVDISDFNPFSGDWQHVADTRVSIHGLDNKSKKYVMKALERTEKPSLYHRVLRRITGSS